MLKSFFLSERKLLNAILRVKLKYMKDVSFSWNEMLFAMQKTDFHNPGSLEIRVSTYISATA